MPIPDTMHTFTHYLTQVSAMKLAYVQLVRYLPIMDIPVPVPPSARQMEDGRQYKRGVPHDVLAVYAAVKEARRRCVEEGRAVLVETMTYRCVAVCFFRSLVRWASADARRLPAHAAGAVASECGGV